MRGVAWIALALLCACGLGLWYVLPARTSGSAPPAPQAPAEPLVISGDQLLETRPADAPDSARGSLDPARVAEATSFDGDGTIRGRIGARAGSVFPLEWELVLEPHPYLLGRERAESRRVPFRAGEREFKIEHLSLGGYRVRAVALALNSSSADVMLVKGSPDQFVELAFTPAGWFDGSVLDARGAPAEGIVVRLLETGAQAPLETTTDGAGAFQFRALLDGDYEISFCACGQPLLEPRLVSFRAPRLTFPQVKLPETATLVVHVFDLLGNPAAGVRVTGFGRPRGAIDMRTDEQGVARLRWALPGRWDIQAQDESANLGARGEVEFGALSEASLALRLVR